MLVSTNRGQNKPLIQLTLNPLTWKIWWAPNNASRWQMGFNSVFKGLSQWSRNAWRIIEWLCTGYDTGRTISFQLVHITALSEPAWNVRWTYSAQTADQPDTRPTLTTPTTKLVTSTSAPSIFSNLHSYLKISFLLETYLETYGNN